MYLQFFGLKEAPFSITPDPRFVFLSERHRDGLAHLLYGIGQGGSGGFVQLTGEVGTGKTTLCRLLLEQLPADTRVALVLNPRLSSIELLETIAEELHIDVKGRRGSLKRLVDALNAYLLDAYAKGLKVVLIIDEAQNLSADALEQVRLLTNLETPTQKLLQIILLGQPELRDLLARDELRQLAQRITARHHLTPLAEEETANYVHHRLSIAGSSRSPFSRLALRRIYQHSGGVPRLINVISDRALLAGFAASIPLVGEREVDAAAAEVMPRRLRRTSSALRVGASSIAAVGLFVTIAAVLFWPRLSAPNKGPIKAIAAAKTREPENALFDSLALSAQIGDAARSPLNAWTKLLALWLLRSDQVDAATAARCPAKLAAELYCLRGSGSLAKLETLKRPVILRLTSQGAEAWAVLLGLDRAHAQVALAGETFDLKRRDLERVWLGEYLALWRAPDLPTTLRSGDRGGAVDWLRDRLASQSVLSQPGALPGLYDAELVTAVQRLQAAHGLVPDGIFGPETLFALMGDEDGGPRLRTSLR